MRELASLEGLQASLLGGGGRCWTLAMAWSMVFAMGAMALSVVHSMAQGLGVKSLLLRGC